MPASPLPDSSALEAGIIEDERPSRLSRVQDNVRNLLRTSVFGSVKSSPTTPTHPRHIGADLPTPISIHHEIRADVLPSPPATASSIGSSTAHHSERTNDGAAAPPPPESYCNRVQHMAHQSTLFNTRAVAALNHPDLSDPSLEDLSQQKTQRRKRNAQTRSKNGRRRHRPAQRAAGSRGVLCLLAALLLAALVATYVSVATTETSMSTTFHILFVLGICLATIVFAHAVIRLFFVGRRSRNRPLFVAVTRHGQHRHQHQSRRQRHPQLRQMPSLSSDPDAFVPPLPIQVHVSPDEVQADPNVAQLTAGERTSEDWDKEVHSLPNPPPAYGRWRGSVRADPEMLHWHAVPSPISPDTPALPSPTYEEAIATAQNESPPSYMTRESPARQREMRETRAGIARSQVIEVGLVPEMVETRGPGVGLAI